MCRQTDRQTETEKENKNGNADPASAQYNQSISNNNNSNNNNNNNNNKVPIDKGPNPVWQTIPSMHSNETRMTATVLQEGPNTKRFASR